MAQKTILMIARTYYPSNASGAHRPVAFSKYLRLYDWDPIVVCKDYNSERESTYDRELANKPDACEVIRVRDIQSKILSRLELLGFTYFGGGEMDYRNPYIIYQRMLKVAEQIIQNRRIDAIWSTFMPGYPHTIASYLSQKYQIPWVADFRDLPDQTLKNSQSLYAVKQEMQICANAKALVACTNELSDMLRKRHVIPVHTILNGFDPDDYCEREDTFSLDSKFTINYFGILYSYRSPKVLFQAIDKMIKQGIADADDIQVNFYGSNANTVRSFTKGYDCETCVQVKKRLSYHEMIIVQKRSQILLLLAPPEQGGAIPAKLYGYLASKRPILSVPGDGMGSDRILRDTKAGVSLAECDKILEWLSNAFAAYKEAGYVPYNGVIKSIDQYSRISQTQQLADILGCVS